MVDKYLAVAHRDGFDFGKDFSALFPVDVITTLQGVPRVNMQNVAGWSHVPVRVLD
nr:hypothetical protein [Mycobacterium gordonae]